MAHGQIFARFALRNGATRLIEHRQSAPLKIARTFPSETRRGGLDVCVMDASPGLLCGDRHDYQWIVEAGAQVRITTQGATRVHPARAPGDPERGDEADAPFSSRFSSQFLRARVAAEARLELWPETIIPFGGARFASHSEIEMDSSAHLTVFECLSAGRIARGEVFAFDEVSLFTKIIDAHGPLFCARSRFHPVRFDPRGRFCFGEFLHWATLLRFGPAEQIGDAGAVQEKLPALRVHGSASRLARGGAVLSILGQRACDVRDAALDMQSS